MHALRSTTCAAMAPRLSAEKHAAAAITTCAARGRMRGTAGYEVDRDATVAEQTSNLLLLCRK